MTAESVATRGVFGASALYLMTRRAWAVLTVRSWWAPGTTTVFGMGSQVLPSPLNSPL
jgi:hypothetical protein